MYGQCDMPRYAVAGQVARSRFVAQGHFLDVLKREGLGGHADDWNEVKLLQFTTEDISGFCRYIIPEANPQYHLVITGHPSAVRCPQFLHHCPGEFWVGKRLDCRHIS